MTFEQARKRLETLAARNYDAATVNGVVVMNATSLDANAIEIVLAHFDSVLRLAIREKLHPECPAAWRFAVQLLGTWGPHNLGYPTRELAELAVIDRAVELNVSPRGADGFGSTTG
jgi:hypothetical protein